MLIKTCLKARDCFYLYLACICIEFTTALFRRDLPLCCWVTKPSKNFPVPFKTRLLLVTVLHNTLIWSAQWVHKLHVASGVFFVLKIQLDNEKGPWLTKMYFCISEEHYDALYINPNYHYLLLLLSWLMFVARWLPGNYGLNRLEHIWARQDFMSAMLVVVEKKYPDYSSHFFDVQYPTQS